MIINYISIPNVFAFYTALVNKRTYNYKEMAAVHYCTKCGQQFKAVWPVRSNMGWEYVDYRVVVCPRCGEVYYPRNNTNDKLADMGDTVPLKMILKLEQFKYGYKLTISGKSLRAINDEVDCWSKGKYCETITFDIDKRRTVFKKSSKDEELVLGDPFDTTFYDNSILKELYSQKMIKPYQAKITALLKQLREEICKKLSKKMGHKIKPMYRQHLAGKSLMIAPIMNIAYRMICLDAPNLSNRVFNEHDYSEKSIAPVLVTEFTADQMNIIKAEKDTISGFIKIAGIPNKRAFRKIIADEPFDYKLLSMIYSNFNKNIDNTVRIYKKMNTKNEQGVYPDYRTIEKMLVNAEIIKQYYDGNDAVKLFKDNEEEFKDTAYMLGRMNRIVKDAFIKEKPSIMKAHDWLAQKEYEIKNAPINFEINEVIRKRLTMQLDSIKFFMPKTSTELKLAGKKLHNCVGTYTDQIINNYSQIVLVANDKGKLVVCIEIKDNKIVQAKLFGNKKVASDTTLNAEVIAWAKKAKLDYTKCNDIAQEIKVEIKIG